MVVRLLVVSLLGLCLAPQGGAVEYPTRTVTIVVPFSAGGGADRQARLIARSLSARLNKPVIVDNRPGAGGQIAANVVARASPDGHTLLLGENGTLVLGFVLRGRHPLQDLAAVTAITEMPLVLVSSASLPMKDVSELIALARRKPGELTYASAGPGSLAHLIGELFKASAHLDIVHVPSTQKIVAVVKSREFVQAAESEGAFIIGGSANELTQRIEADWAAMGKLIKALDLRVEE